MGAWTDGKVTPPHPRSSGDLGQGSQARQGMEPAGPAGTWLPCVSSARCRGNGLLPGQQAWLPPHPKRSQVLLTATRGAGSQALLRPLAEEQEKGKSQRGSLLESQKERTSLQDGTRSRNAPTACAFRHGRMKRHPRHATVRPVTQGADVGYLLLGRPDGGTGWAWGARALGCLRRKDRRTPPPCSRSPLPPGLPRPTRLRTRVASARAQVSQTRGRSRGKARPGFPGARFGRAYWAGGLENPDSIVVESQ